MDVNNLVFSPVSISIRISGGVVLVEKFNSQKMLIAENYTHECQMRLQQMIKGTQAENGLK